MTYTFPPYRFDAEGTLWKDTEQVALTRKAAAVLRCLLAGGGSWISKAAIMAAVWPDTHVQPDNVKVLVREIRQALDDRPQPARFIKSARGRGYAFVAPVARDAHGDGEASSASASPVFVGRRAELAVLADALDAARASSRRVVLVSGERGIGKTAICEAFIRTASATDPLHVCFGRCFDRETPHEPYYPFIDAFVRLGRVHPALVQTSLTRHAPSLVARFPSGLVASHATPPVVPVFEELAAALDAMAHERPLVVVLEDLQWADVATVHALAKLAETPAHSQLIIIGTCSDGEWTAGTRAKNRLRNALAVSSQPTHIALGSLTVEHVERYLAARFGPDCVVALAPAMHHLTGGNPFMLSTTSDSLVFRKQVVPDGHNWSRDVSIDAMTLSLTESMGDTARREFDRLDPDEREVVAAAALIGLEFTAAAVASALLRKTDQVRTLLDVLARRSELIVAPGGSGLCASNQATYRFRHPVFRRAISSQAPALMEIRVRKRLDDARGQTLRRA